MTDDMAVYIANLGRYNEGYLVGAWFTFPIDEEDVKEKIGLNEQYEEYAIHDTDNFPIEIGEYISIEELKTNNIRYVEGAQFRGKSGLLCQYDFVLLFTSKQAERFCTSITRPSQRLISSTLFSWEDTQTARKTPSELVVFLNDSDRRIDNQLITALEKYNAYPIKWSEREFKENLYKLAS